MHFYEQTKHTGCSCRMRRDAAEVRLAKISGSSRREERVEARRSRRLQVLFIPPFSYSPFISLRVRDAVDPEKSRAEDAPAKTAREEGRGQFNLSHSLMHFTSNRG